MRSPEARSIQRPRPVQVIAVTGGKGGVGKTSVSVTLAAEVHDGARACRGALAR